MPVHFPLQAIMRNVAWLRAADHGMATPPGPTVQSIAIPWSATQQSSMPR